MIVWSSNFVKKLDKKTKFRKVMKSGATNHSLKIAQNCSNLSWCYSTPLCMQWLILNLQRVGDEFIAAIAATLQPSRHDGSHHFEDVGSAQPKLKRRRLRGKREKEKTKENNLGTIYSLSCFMISWSTRTSILEGYALTCVKLAKPNETIQT